MISTTVAIGCIILLDEHQTARITVGRVGLNGQVDVHDEGTNLCTYDNRVGIG